MSLFSKTIGLFGLAYLSMPSLLGGLISSTPSMAEYASGIEELIVYTDVPNHATQTPLVAVKPGINPQNEIRLNVKSDIYEIRVKSAATDGQWIQCFANYTYNRATEIEDIPRTDGSTSPVVIQNYQKLTGGWSHTYANIEMSPNSPVEVEISKIGGTLLNGSLSIVSSAVHPAYKVTDLPDLNGKVYFTINNPCQIVIDINGQMDDHNAAINPMPGNAPVHGITLFANPMMTKPDPLAPRTHQMMPGVVSTPDPATFDTMIFEPGVHQIGVNFKIHPGKTYYIPGDAIVFGTLNNYNVSAAPFRARGDGIKINGYGTLSGVPYQHYLYNPVPYSDFSDVAITIDDGVSVGIEGITVMDTANHSQRLEGWQGADAPADLNRFRWVKVITWRANGDGIGAYAEAEDCFLRTADDASYCKGDRRRLTFWKDVNAALFHMATIPTTKAIVLEDCDVIYNRLRTASGSNGGGFQLRGGNGNSTGENVRDIDVTIRNFRFHDKRSNMSAINLVNFETDAGNTIPGEGYRGIKFENISIEPPINGVKQKLLGCQETPWFGGLIFKNITIGQTLLTAANFTTYFQTNEFAQYMLFDDPQNLTLTASANANEGSITKNPSQATHLEMSPVELRAISKPGLFVFSHWTGDASGTDNPLTVWMTASKAITANFIPATINAPVVIKDSISGSWTVPAGVYSATIQAWGGGGAGGSAYNGATSGANTQARGGGGAGGSYSSKTLRVSPGQVISYAVGAGGVAAPSGFTHNSDGATGGTSTATYNTELTTAMGGPGGKNISATNQVLGGTGGITPNTGNLGDAIFLGGNGGTSGSGGTGGGGGSAGSLGDGGNGAVATAGLAGLGGGATGGAGNNETKDGKLGESPGAGGSGAGVRSNAYTHQTGGNGGDGQMVVIYNTMSFTLTATTTPLAGASIELSSPGGTYPSGTTIGVTAVPPPGYQFTGWSGALSGATNPTTILMDDNKSITANFEVEPPPESVWDGGGTADGLGNFNWSDAANWILAAPLGGNLIFAGNTGATTFNNIAADTSFTGITFTNTAAPFTLSGNRITLSGDVINHDTDLQTLNLDMILSPTRTFNTASGNLTVGGILSGTGGFIKSGPGTLTLTAANTYSGTTVIQDGILLTANGNNRLPTATSVILGNGETSGVIQLGNSTTARSQTVASITTSGTGTSNRVVGFHPTNTSTFTVNNSSDVTYDGLIGGPNPNNNRVALTKNGAGTLTLSGSHTHIGINTVTGGILQVNQATGGLGDSTAANTINLDGGTLSLRNNATTIYGSASNPAGYKVQLSSSSTIHVANVTANIGNTIQLGPLTQATASTRTLHITGANNYALRLPSLNLNPGLGQNTTLNPTTASLIIAGNVTNPMSGFNSGNFDTLTLSGTSTGNLIQGVISDAVGASAAAGGLTRLTKTGDSTWQLTASNTYDGITTVSAGTLLINGDSSAANGTVTVNGGSLGGNGIIGGNVTVAAAGSLTPGNLGVGTLALNSSLNIGAQAAGTGKLHFELGPIATSDKIVVSGALNIGSGALGFGDFNFTALTGLENGTYKLITNASGIIGTLDPVVVNRTGTIGVGPAQGTLQFTGTDLELIVIGVTSADPYLAWAGGALFNADENNDGVENGLAWLLGAPSPTSNVERPVITHSSSGLVMTFNMRNSASRGSAVLQIEHSNDLAISDPWTGITVPETTSAAPSNDVTFTITPGSPLNTVVATISISEAATGRLFGRLKGEK